MPGSSRLFLYSQGMSLLEQINARLRQESGMANHEAFKTETANNALMDYLSNKGTAKAAAEAFNQVANEAIASGKLTAAEVSALEGYVGTTQTYVDAMVLMGDNGVGGVGTVTGKYIGSTSDLTPAEKTVVDDLVAQGKTVERIPSDPKAIEKRPDFLVDDVLTELKTLENPNTNTGMKRIQKGFIQGADTVILDARDTGLTEYQANEIINRVAGKYPNKIIPGKIEIWIIGKIVVYPK